ncbi:MAG: hypothetical protein U0Q12_02890 [Vicinamibacterales bacterium]
MILSKSGELRVGGYLFLLEQSLRTCLPRDVAADAVREIESHLRDRVAAADATPDERAALERILTELGSPLRVAQAYSAERVVDEAVVTGRFVPTVRAIALLAVSTVAGFFAALGLFIGYTLSLSFLAVALLKPVFPDNVGFAFVDGWPVSLSAQFPVPPNVDLRGGYWVIPVALLLGLGSFVLTQRLARRFLAWMRSRRTLIREAAHRSVDSGAEHA